jgi:DNA-binding transcriptional MocR family regulator
MQGDKTAQWLRPLNPASGPRYLQIVELIAQAVAKGVLRPGDRLPPQRRLAEQLNVDLTTVTRAYLEARHRNLLDAVTGRGSFVSAREAQTGPAIDLSMNIPPAPRGVRLADLMQRGIVEILASTNVDRLMTYHAGTGSRADRAAGCAWLEPLLGAVEPQRLVVTAGAQPALVALMRWLASPGDVLLVEPLAYPGLLAAARLCGLRPVAVEADAEGLLPEALDRAAQVHAARLLALTPTIQNPTTATMPLARREALLDVVRARGLKVIEDDPYSLLAGDAPPPLAALAPESVYHLATLSKVLTPGLRTAFIVLPPGLDGDGLAGHLRSLTQMPAPLMTALATHWIRIGAAQDLLDGVREEATARQDLARAILPGSIRAHPNGLHVWLPLPPHWDRHRLIETARLQGLGVTPSDVFAAGGVGPDAVRISLGGVPERSRLAEALRLLAAIIDNERAGSPAFD